MDKVELASGHGGAGERAVVTVELAADHSHGGAKLVASIFIF